MTTGQMIRPRVNGVGEGRRRRADGVRRRRMAWQCAGSCCWCACRSWWRRRTWSGRWVLVADAAAGGGGRGWVGGGVGRSESGCDMELQRRYGAASAHGPSPTRGGARGAGATRRTCQPRRATVTGRHLTAGQMWSTGQTGLYGGASRNAALQKRWAVQSQRSATEEMGGAALQKRWAVRAWWIRLLHPPSRVT